MTSRALKVSFSLCAVAGAVALSILLDHRSGVPESDTQSGRERQVSFPPQVPPAVDLGINAIGANMGNVPLVESRRLLEAIERRLRTQPLPTFHADPHANSAVHVFESSHVLTELSRVAQLEGDLAAAQEYAQRALDIVQESTVKGMKNSSLAATAANRLMVTARFNKDWETAREAAKSQLEMKSVQTDTFRASAALHTLNPAESDEAAAITTDLYERSWLRPLIEASASPDRGDLRQIVAYAYERRGQLAAAEEQLNLALREIEDKPTIEYLRYSAHLAPIVETLGRVSDAIDVCLRAAQRADEIRLAHLATRDQFTKDITRELDGLEEGFCYRLQGAGGQNRPDAALWAVERLLDRGYASEPQAREQLNSERMELLAALSAGK